MTKGDPSREADNERENEDQRQIRIDHANSELNSNALLALRLMLPEIIAPIVRLLRSDAKIDILVRHELADALERTETSPARVRFTVEGQATGRGAHMGIRLANFNRDVEIARWVDARLTEEPALGVRDVIQAAADRFVTSFKSVERMRTAVSKMDHWLAANMPVKPIDLSFLDDTQWESFRQAKYRAVRDGDPPLQ